MAKKLDTLEEKMRRLEAERAEREKKLKEELRQLDLQRRELEKSIRHQQRQTETKQKIIYGAAAMRFMETNEKFRNIFLTFVEDFVVRPGDREILGLKPKTIAPPAVEAEVASAEAAAPPPVPMAAGKKG